MNESLNNHLQAFQAIKEIPESKSTERHNLLASARIELLKAIEIEHPEKASEITALQEIAPDTNVSNETIDSYIRIIERV